MDSKKNHFCKIVIWIIWASIRFRFGTKSFVVVDAPLLTITDGTPRISSYRWSESLDSFPVITRAVFLNLTFLSFLTVANAVPVPAPACGPLWLYLQFSANLQKPFPLVQLWQGILEVSTSVFLIPRFRCVEPPFPFPPFLWGLFFFVAPPTLFLKPSGAPFQIAALPAVHFGSPLKPPQP